MSDPLARYQLGDPIARPEGSVSDAYHAVDKETGAAVTLEIVRAGATSVDKARFGTRARRLANVDHPSLVKVTDAGATHCAFERPRGVPLTEHAGLAVARARQKLAWLARLAGALAALHKGAVVHGRFGLDEIVVQEDGAVKLSVPLSGDLGGSPLDDLRALGAAACRLLVGEDLAGQAEPATAERLVDAGLPGRAAAILARTAAGRTVNSADLAEELAPFADANLPTTERLLPIAPRR